jgi:uncharacterized protein YqkB
MNRIITKATNSLKATFSVNPKFSIDKNILEQMSFSVSDALSTAIGISTTINTYTPYNTAIEVPTKTKKIDSSIFTDGKTINYNTIYDTLAEKYNIPSERITVTIKN